MVLSIKIKDDIWIPTTNPNIKLSDNFEQAQNSIANIFKVNQEKDEVFNEFNTTIQDNFNPSETFNLYYLADGLEIAQVIIVDDAFYNQFSSVSPSRPIETQTENAPNFDKSNLLNNFGYRISNYPTPEQFDILNDLKLQKIIDYYWIEGEINYLHDDEVLKDEYKIKEEVVVSVTETNESLALNLTEDFTIEIGKQKSIPASNNYYMKELGLKSEKNRGLGATIICMEQNATANLFKWKNKFIKDLKASTIPITSKDIDETQQHQLETLVTLFAKIPKGEKNVLNQPEGIIPEANLVVSSIYDSKMPFQDPLLKFSKMDVLRKTLMGISIEIIKGNLQNAILLFEFSINVPRSANDENPVSYPLSIDPEINRMLNSLILGKNVISVTGSGNAGISFDGNAGNIWNNSNLGYTDLSINNPSLIMIGDATKDKNTIKSVFNKSDSLDAYLYTDIGITKMNNKLTSFGGTSAASAIAAGIITFLQGKALIIPGGRKPLTTKMVKNVFKQTFMKNYPDKILTKHTLNDLWNKCQLELRNSQQHQ